MSHLENYAVVFPGQGSQSIGMLADIAAAYPEVKKIFEQASDSLAIDLWKLTQAGPVEKLDETQYTQPILLCASYAIWQLLAISKSKLPTLLAGHSLGEYTALVCTQSLDFTDAIKLVHARGLFMQEAVPLGIGAMAAIIGLDEAMVSNLCQQARLANEVLMPANFNSIGQIVISGHKQSVENAIKLAKESGAKLAMLLPVSVPSHSDLMRPAADRLSQLLDQINFNMPTAAVVSNTTAKPYLSIDDIRQGLIKQLYLPVRWVETIQYFVEQGIQTIVECGPGKILTGLNKRIDKKLNLVSTSDLTMLQSIKKNNEESHAA